MPYRGSLPAGRGLSARSSAAKSRRRLLGQPVGFRWSDWVGSAIDRAGSAPCRVPVRTELYGQFKCGWLHRRHDVQHGGYAWPCLDALCARCVKIPTLRYAALAAERIMDSSTRHLVCDLKPFIINTYSSAHKY
jgi:hypothetical protein